MSFYHGQEPGCTPGVLSTMGPEHHDYAWWEAGALWGTMIDYWKYTGDRTYNDIVQASLVAQVGPDRNYMEPNVSAFIGNDDQAFWGLSAMLAAESNFQNPPQEDPQWLALAQGVFNSQTGPARRDGSCAGGLRWQVFALNRGYDYKNAISNGLYFNLGARLARYTGDRSYAQHAAETFDWMLRVGLIDGGSFDVFDGAHVEQDCRDINRAQFSYNVAVLLQGAAFMYDLTGSVVWAQRVDGLLDSMLRTFFTPPVDGGDGEDKIAFEPACEGGVSNVPADGCTSDMLAFKGFGARWMTSTMQLCPWTRSRIVPVLRASAKAAVRQCSGGFNKRMCGMHWASGTYDGSVGVGQEMNVLSALMVLLDDEPTDSHGEVVDWFGESHATEQLPHVPLTHNTGGTSNGNPNAGDRATTTSELEFEPITDADVTSASILTSGMIVFMFAVFVFMCSETDRPQRKEYNELSDIPHRPKAEVDFVKAPVDWLDLEERRPSRGLIETRTTATNVKPLARPAKSRIAFHKNQRAEIYREDGDSGFGGDEASEVDGLRTRMSRTRVGGGNLNKRGKRFQGRLDVAAVRGPATRHPGVGADSASSVFTHGTLA